MPGILNSLVEQLQTIQLEPDPEDIQTLRTVKQMLPQYRDALRKAKRAGMDIDAAMESIERAERDIDKLIQTYG